MRCLQQGLPLPLSRHVVARPLVNELIRYPSVVVVDSTAGAIHGVQWEVEGDAGDWDTIQREGWFGVRPEVLGPVFGGGFDRSKPYVFTLMLLPTHWQPLGLLASGPDALVDFLRGLDFDEPSRHPSAWRLLSVMQPQGDKFQVGLTTRYFNESLP